MTSNYNVQTTDTTNKITRVPNCVDSSFSNNITLNELNNFYLGVIEGFFGEPWNKEQRLDFIKWASKNNLKFFIYCPKNDPALRRLWREDYSKEWIDYILELSKTCKDNNIDFGIGFTPLEATKDLDSNLPLIKSKIKFLLKTFSPQILAILFDDLKIDNNDEGIKQNLILKEILSEVKAFEKEQKQLNTVNEELKNRQESLSNITSNNNSSLNIKIITCPSFYTTDPILEKVFGTKPNNYHKNFLKDLDESVNVFWTGYKVMSDKYSIDDLEYATKLLGKKPFIWDNYPVNDGKKSSNYLNIKPFSNRINTIQHSNGLAINPMKQIELSKLPISTFFSSIIEEIKSIQKDNSKHMDNIINTSNNSYIPFSLLENHTFKALLDDISKNYNLTEDKLTTLKNSYLDKIDLKFFFLKYTSTLADINLDDITQNQKDEILNCINEIADTNYRLMKDIGICINLNKDNLDMRTYEEIEQGKSILADKFKFIFNIQNEITKYLNGEYAFDPNCLTG